MAECLRESAARSASYIRSMAARSRAASATTAGSIGLASPALFDVDCNLTHAALQGDAERLLAAARAARVRYWLVPGSSVADSSAAIELSRKVSAAIGDGSRSVLPTAGVHPFLAAKQLETHSVEQVVASLRSMVPEVVALGECGLDFSEGFPDPEVQMRLFEPQVDLACDLGMPIFLHERFAHDQLMSVLRSKSRLPRVLVHCFTGTAAELQTYLDEGFFVSFSGLICREEAGSGLRDAIATVRPSLDRIMVETDAPYLGFPGCRASERTKAKAIYPNVPAALPAVVRRLADVLGVDEKELARQTTANAIQFFSH